MNNVRALRIAPQAVLHEFERRYSSEVFERLTGEELTRLETAIKESGVTAGWERFIAHVARQMAEQLRKTM